MAGARPSATLVRGRGRRAIKPSLVQPEASRKTARSGHLRSLDRALQPALSGGEPPARALHRALAGERVRVRGHARPRPLQADQRHPRARRRRFLLRAMGQLLRERLRKSDIACRYGRRGVRGRPVRLLNGGRGAKGGTDRHAGQATGGSAGGPVGRQDGPRRPVSRPAGALAPPTGVAARGRRGDVCRQRQAGAIV